MTYVTHLSYRTTSGGAARSASRIHQTLLSRGIDSALLAVENESGAERVYSTRPSMKPWRRLYRHSLRTLYRILDRVELEPQAPCGVFTSDRSFRRAEVIGELRDPKVIHMHWVAEMFDERLFLPAATRLAPVIWTMRDMRPITGGCHNNVNCQQFQSGCGHCPQLAHPGPRDISYRNFNRRRQTFSRIDPSRLVFVSPSKWLAREFASCPLYDGFHVQVIPNGVDTEVFFPEGRQKARESLGISPHEQVILFNAFSLENRLKGGHLLVAAIGKFAEKLRNESSLRAQPRSGCSGTEPPVRLLVIGAGRMEAITDIPTLPLGHLDNDTGLAAAYRAADLFVIPSLQDNCPNTVLESFASGVPAVGFETSGIADLVIPGTTGLLAQPYDAADLAEKILRILQDRPLRQRMSAECRSLALTEYSRTVEAERYLGLYQQMIAQHSGVS